MHSLISSLRRSRISAALVLAIFVAIGVRLSAQQQQPVASSNINMVSGTTFPDGDPYLQRQNEPNAAVSTRNPLHLLAGANDYRTVDLPGPFDPMRGFKMAADAWVSLFKSVDGGQNWKSTLLPGFPQDVSADGLSSPIKGREGATDPIMRAGTNGLFYYAGVAFDRGANRPSAIFVARYMDLNNREAGDPFGYVDTRLVDSDSGTRFLDKVALATDIPRTAATCTITSHQTGDKPGDPPIEHVRTIPAGNVYAAYAAFTGSGATEQSVIMISRSTNCGQTWGTPIALSTGSRLVQNPQIAVSPTDGAVYVSWRRFAYTSQDDAVMIVKSINGGATFSKPLRVAGVRSFDLPTLGTQFRSNAFQTMAIDGTGRVYLAWPDRGYAAVRSDPVTGDSRIVTATSTNGSTWSVPRAIQPEGVGHQLMPAMAFHGGKLRVLYYDLREDVSGLFGPRIDEADVLNGASPRIRHTMDVFVAQALPGATPAFTTARVSEYVSGFMPGSTVETRLQFNPPNLPMFRQGAVPFMGDYIDLAPSPPFILNDNGTWSFNTGANGSTVSHAMWTDNRDVRPPANGNWADYTPVTSPAVGSTSRFDPTQQVPSCVPGQVGMRNQNIYTARVTDGLFVSAPGNNKQFNGFQRAFVVVAENASPLARVYRLNIENQPIGGQASFLQFGAPLTTLDVTTPPLSSVARSVFVTAQDQSARVRVSVTEITGIGGTVVANGLTGTVVLNPDPQNPVLQNPVLQNPVLQNPVLQNISQGESYNPAITAALVGVPNLQNPVLQNPNLQNPNLQNPSIQNPHLQNPNLQNPNLQNPVLQNDAVANPSIVNADLQNPVLQNPVLQNPNLQNPNLQNPNLQNAGISDTNWVVTNEGNTTASYTVNLLLNNPVPAGFTTQLLIHKTFTTPAADGCELKEQAHTILLANIPDPVFLTDPTNPNLQNPHLQNPNLQNPTLALAPGESATVTLRIIDPNIFDGTTYDASAAVTPAAVAQSVNTDDVAAGDTTPSVALPLTITTSEIPPTTPGAPINRQLGFVAATGTVTCAVVPGLGSLPPGVSLSSTGALTGTPTAPGNYEFTVECVASGPPERRDRQTLTIQVNPASPVGFDVLWNGLDNNWYNPANWSPRGVPAQTARVYLSAATDVVPRLTADVTVRDLFLEPGATLDTNGFTLTVTNNADAGRTIIGLGQTVLTGNGSTAAGVFSNLLIAGRITLSAPLTTTGTLTLAPGARLELNGQPLIVGGQLITNATGGTLPMVVAGAGNSFIVTGVNVNGLVLNGAPLTINGAALTRFDNVSFSGFAPDAIQLTVNNPGLLTHFPMNGLSFSSQPTSGQYISATDTLPGGALLVLDVTGAVPADGSAFTLETGGAEVNWLGNPGEANLAVTQTVAPVPAPAGTRLNYVITVTNGGPAAAASVVLNAQVPLDATGLLATTPQGACTPGPIGVSCALGTIAAGASVQATVSFITSVAGTLSTTAVVTSTTPDAVIANNSHTINAVVVAVGQGVDLRLSKTDSLDPVAVNAPFTYTLTVTNVGTTQATNVVVTDNVPSGIAITYATSADGMCSAIGAQVLCSFAAIPPGQTVTMTLNATAGSVAVWTNQASVTSAQIELTPADNVVAEPTTVIAEAPAANLRLTMRDSADPVAFGASFDYVITVENLGPNPALGVSITDTLPAGLTAAVASASQGTCTIGSGTVTCNVGTLGVGASVTATITASGSATVTNTASVTAETFDPTPANNSASEATTIQLPSCTAGSFSGPRPYAGAAGPMAVVRLVDMNHDGRLDAVATHEGGSDGVDVFLNDGAGGFAAPLFTSTVTGPWMHVVADFNGDTHPDVITATDREAPGQPITLRMLANDGSGVLTLVPGFSIPFGGNLTNVDLDRDGDQDLVIATTTGGLALLRNDGQANFGAPETILAGAVGFAAFGDFNGDSRTDVAATLGTPGVAVVLANPAGGFLPPVTFPVAGGAHAAAGPVDLNGDDRLDLLVIAGDDDEPAAGVSVLFGDGAGGLSASVLATNDFVYFPTLTDVNGDGRADLVGISSLGSFAVWRGTGGAGFSAPTQFANATYYGPTVGDINADGRPDIVTGDINGTLNVFLSVCGGTSTDLGVAVSESGDPVNEGDELVYTVTVTNQSATPASGVRSTSVLAQFVDDDPGVPNVAVLGSTSSAGGTLSATGGTHVWTLPTLAAHATATFTFRFRPLQGGTLEFSTAATSEDTELDPSNNAASATTAVTAVSSTIQVTTAADSGPGSLRNAIELSNADSGDLDTIVFNIPGAGVPTITLQSQLPPIEEPVVIDATTQPTTARVEVNGNGVAGTGLVIRGGNSLVRGLVLNRFPGDAIAMELNGGNVVEGNFIGTDPTGTVARANGTGGVRVFSANNRIGGLNAAARNVISGNQNTGITLQNATATGNVVRGNYIGLNAAGTAALPNLSGIAIFNGASNNTLGGEIAGAGNIVSGNTGSGISVNGAAANDNVVQGNFIGTDPSGAIRLANGGSGVDIASAQRTIVGGTGLARNVISGNGVGIQIRSGATGTRVRNNYVGLNAAGTAPVTNSTGISINSGAGADNIIGGSQAGQGNVISGNTAVGINISGGSNGTVVQGNLIGLDAAGNVDLGNTGDGINLNGVSGTAVGGSTATSRNVISGNNNVGLRITGATATGNLIRGNYIGVNAAGSAAVGNTNGGILVLSGAAGNTLGGSAAGEGNVISGNNQYGISVQAAANGNTIQGNLIGLNAAGTQAVGNATHGIDLNTVSATIVGGTVDGAGNVISGNAAYGIRNGANTTGTVVYGNRIGTNAAGTGPAPNGLSGILVDGSGTTIGGTAAGTANRIAYNGTIGVNVVAGTGHAIVGNSIFSNGELGINLGTPAVTANDAGDGDAGENNLQNYPVLAAAPGGVQGTFNSTPNAAFTIHYYGNAVCDQSGNGEGQTYLGSVPVNTDANGNATLPLFSAAADLVVTATATSATNDTSEFSACAAVPPSATTFTVTNTNDSGSGSLRQAILDANARAGTTDTIAFNIAGEAPFSIALQSALPVITDPVVLDGRSQPGFSGQPVIELNGAGAGPGTTGLRIGTGSVVRGLVINRFSSDGISLFGSVGGSVVAGNYIGTNLAGTAPFPNINSGIRVNSPGNQLGGTATEDGNVIAANGTGIQLESGATNTLIKGNRIGTDFAGVAAVPNGAGINVSSSHGNTIGGPESGAGNLISGNSGNGIWISGGNNNSIQRNFIGTNASGAGSLANGFGLSVGGGNNSIIGNVISGNTNTGIGLAVGATATVIQGNRVGVTSSENGSAALPNGGHGIHIDGAGTTVGGAADGESNVIANNGLAGVRVNSGARHALLRNAIFSNGGLGIDIGTGGISGNDAGDGDSGANNLQNFPVLVAAPGGVEGTLNSTPNGTFTIRFFGNAACDPSGNGEGQTYLGAASVGTDADGNASLPLFVVSPAQVVTATATSAEGDTSEFSTCVTSRPPNGAPVANAGPDQTAYVAQLVTLNGSGNDPDDDDVTYAWSFSARPADSQATLSNATTASSTFTPDVPGTYTLQLIVDDGTDSSVPDSVSVTVLSNEIAVSLEGAQVVGVARQSPVRVTLPFAASAGGTMVTLTSANPGFLSVVAPGTASIPQGQTVGQIMVRGEGSGTAVLRANAPGYGQGTLSVVVTHNLISTPATLNVAFGGSTALPINIGPDPAPPGGLTLDVASSAADIEVLTAQVTVPAGALSANATVRGARVGAANVTVSNPNYAPSTTAVTSRAELNIVQTTASFNQGLTPPTITVRLESNGTQIAAQPALAVTLTSANTNCVTVPSSVTIAAGLVSTSFTPAYGGSATLPCTTTVTASAPDVTADSLSVTVNAPAAISAGGTMTVGAGLMDSAFASLGAAQHGGVDVTITAPPGPVRLSRLATEVGTQSITVHLDNGQTSISYYVHSLETTTGSSTITLSANGFTNGSQTVDVVQPALEIVGLNQSMNTLSGPDTDVYAQVGITHPSYNNAQLWQVQSVRPGGSGLPVTLTNSNSAVARLRSDEPAATGGQTGQVVTKTIPAGTYYTHPLTAGTSYGLAFEPVGTGSTTVTVSAPGALTMTATGVRPVQVTSPVISAGSTLTVGAGLMDSAFASLSAGQHGGVDVTITAPPGAVRLSRLATEVGTQSITVHLDNGQTSISYYVHALENTTGSATITLTAERFTSASQTVTVVQPALEIVGLNQSMNTLSGPDTDVYAQVGITHPSYNNAQLWQVQSVRPGSSGLPVTLTNSNSAVARLRSDEPLATGGQTGQMVTKTIPAGTYYTHALTAGTSYGLAFEPVGTGSTTVTVSAPGALTMTATGVRPVQVTSPVISAGSTLTVGAGLMDSAFASLSAAQHGGVDVTITVASGPVRVSRLGTEVGTQSITVHLDNGQTSISYYVHALENTTGSATITLTAERFTSVSQTIAVVQPAVEIHNLSGSYTNLSVDDTDIYVQVGITHPSYNNAQLWQVQNVRPGSGGLVVTLTNSNVNVARLRSDEPLATGGQTGQMVTKTIPAGTYYTHALTTGTTYGLAFEPLSNGSTTVTVTAPGALTMTLTGVRPVTVVTPALSVPQTATLGAGLMDGVSATLGASQHGGVDVTITSSAPSVVLVSPNSTTTGAAAIVVHVDNGQSFVPFVIHGLENVSATAVITLSAPGFTSATMSVTVTPSSVEILNLSSSISAGAADDTDLYVQVGITHPSYNNSQIWQVQNVRAGSPGFIVTLTVDDSSRARLRSDEPEATGQTVTKPIQPGYYYTQRFIQAGTTYGLAFDPLAQGTVVVTASGPPGTLPLDSSHRTVVINP